MQNKDYFQLVEQNEAESTVMFYESALRGKNKKIGDFDLAPACRACESPVAENSDIIIGLYGMDIDQSLLVQSRTEAGDQLLKQMNLSAAEEPRGRQDAINALIAQRTEYRDEIPGGSAWPPPP